MWWPKTLVGAERVGDRGQRPAQMLQHHLAVGDVVGGFAQAVHVVGEGVELGRQVGEVLEGLADQGGAEDLGKRPDMRQARGAVAGLEEDEALPRRGTADALQQA